MRAGAWSSSATCVVIDQFRRTSPYSNPRTRPVRLDPRVRDTAASCVCVTVRSLIAMSRARAYSLKSRPTLQTRRVAAVSNEHRRAKPERYEVMFRTILPMLLLAATGISISAELPRGWILAGSRPQDYVVTLDRKIVHSGSVSASLATRELGARGFGTLMQESQPGAYAGERVRLTAQIRSSDVQGWAGLWLRVDGQREANLAFDNMDDRPIKGSTDWHPYSIVLDVPAEASALAYGVLLSGTGRYGSMTFASRWWTGVSP
jgi:hypothetical protein